MLLILQTIIQLSICITFGIDLLFFHKFYYFYKSLYLLVISLLIHYIIHSIKPNTETNLMSLEDMLNLYLFNEDDIDPTVPLNDPINLNKTVSVTVDEWYHISQEIKEKKKEDIICANALKDIAAARINNVELQALTLQFCVDAMHMFFSFRAYMDKYDKLKKNFDGINMLKYLIYSISWCYILFYGLGYVI